MLSAQCLQQQPRCTVPIRRVLTPARPCRGSRIVRCSVPSASEAAQQAAAAEKAVTEYIAGPYGSGRVTIDQSEARPSLRQQQHLPPALPHVGNWHCRLGGGCAGDKGHPSPAQRTVRAAQQLQLLSRGHLALAWCSPDPVKQQQCGQPVVEHMVYLPAVRPGGTKQL